MPLLTQEEYDEFIALYNEARHLTRIGPIREAFRRTVWTQRVLYDTVGKAWIHPVIKAYWFALAWTPGYREMHGTLRESTITATGHHITVFPF